MYLPPTRFAIAALSVTVTLVAAVPTHSAENKFNIVFIISDDLGAQSLACYGNSQCMTPNIDALSKRGVRFTRAYTQYPVCGHSRAALMSGMYAQAIGVTGGVRPEVCGMSGPYSMIVSVLSDDTVSTDEALPTLMVAVGREVKQGRPLSVGRRRSMAVGQKLSGR